MALTERTTIFLNPNVKKFMQREAVQHGVSISELINDLLAELLEDAEDIAAIEDRKNEPLIPWEVVKQRMRRDGIL